MYEELAMFFKQVATAVSGIAVGYGICTIQQKQKEAKDNLTNHSNQITQKKMTILMDDWARCRDNCNAERNRCFDRGSSSANCDPAYDRCIERCGNTLLENFKP